MKRTFFFHKSIQAKLLLSFMVVSLVPLALLGYVSYSWYAGLVEKRTSEYNAELIRSFTNDMDQFLQQVDRFSYTAYQGNFQDLWKESARTESFGKIRNELAMNELILRQEEFYNFRGVIQSVTLLDAEGFVLYENRLTVKSGYRFGDEPWFSALKSGARNSYLVGPYRSQPWMPGDLLPPASADVEDYRLTYVRKVLDLEKPQMTLGYIMLHFGLKEVQRFLEPLLVDDSGTMIIADRQGKIVYAADPEQIGQDISEKMRIRDADRKAYKIVEERGRDYLVTSTSLRMTEWDIYSKNNLGALLSDSREMRNITFVFVACSFGLALVAAQVLSVGLVTPIKRLKNAMVKVSQGYLGVRAGKLSRDEIGELGRYFDEMISQIRFLIEKVYRAELHEREAKLSALQAQINPHFLYNTLETINSIAAVEGVPKVSEIARALSDMFRYSTKTGGIQVSVAEEIRHIQNYLRIVSIRFEEKLSFRLDIPEELHRYRIIKLVFQPIVENAVFHGIETKRGRGEVRIEARREGDDLVFAICDDGAGMSEEQLTELRRRLADVVREPSDGTAGKVGIKNVHDRIRFYYGEAYGLSLDSEPGNGTRVIIRIPAVPA